MNRSSSPIDTISSFAGLIGLSAGLGMLIGLRNLGMEQLPAWYTTHDWGDLALFAMALLTGWRVGLVGLPRVALWLFCAWSIPLVLAVVSLTAQDASAPVGRGLFWTEAQRAVWMANISAGCMVGMSVFVLVWAWMDPTLGRKNIRS